MKQNKKKTKQNKQKLSNEKNIFSYFRFLQVFCFNFKNIFDYELRQDLKKKNGFNPGLLRKRKRQADVFK